MGPATVTALVLLVAAVVVPEVDVGSKCVPVVVVLVVVVAKTGVDDAVVVLATVGPDVGAGELPFAVGGRMSSITPAPTSKAAEVIERLRRALAPRRFGLVVESSATIAPPTHTPRQKRFHGRFNRPSSCVAARNMMLATIFALIPLSG